MSDFVRHRGRKYYFNSCPCGTSPMFTKTHRPQRFQSMSTSMKLHSNNSDSPMIPVEVGVGPMEGRVPWQVLLQNMNNQEICGGSIINLKFILTAAHCMKNFKKIDPEKSFPNNILSILKFENWNW